jgi:tetratricopeptide (TPR) repeat protein
MRMLNAAALLFYQALLVLPFVGAQVATSTTNSADEDLRKGTEAIRDGKADEAEKWFQAALQAAPDNPDALMEFGVAELRLGKTANGVESLQHAVAIAPRMQGANLFLGIGYAQMHKVDQCVAALHRELELDPKNAQAELWLGIVELQDGHPEKATEPLDRAVELAPNDLNILQYRGKAHSAVAYASYARMAVIDPNSWHVHDVQGQMYSQVGQHKEAIAEFQQAIKLAPNNSDLYEELGVEYRKAVSLDLSQQMFAKELELSPGNPVAMYNLAKIDIETNHTEDGLALLRRVVANYSGYAATYFYLGLGEFETGQTNAALADLEKSRSMHPEPDLAPRIEYQLARVYRKLGRTVDANHAVGEYTRLKGENSKLNPTALSAISSGFGEAGVPMTQGPTQDSK